ncbi:MAG: YggW family oxidoreductase [Chromatiales bacterium 21-64-14]|nr:MAG: YggW family oxidoreductase [Chromatiales bacterium 21-64-14]HQU15213.1 radical SAM family heme chaperone HemW [Gammaproteobacteria bacterium]
MPRPALPPLALYVHLPWCVRKCPYCDFNSHEVRGALPEAAYVDALLADLDQEAAAVAGRSLVSVFIGGGTPSLFSAAAVNRLLEGVVARLPGAGEIEVTLEANPGTVEHGRFAELRAAGVNRLSIGVQSFQSRLLPALGRIHGRAEALAAVEEAHRAGFDNFNLDLMYGLPGQRLEEAQDDVRTACALSPTHISLYQLTLEPNTRFHRYPPALPGDDSVWTMQRSGQMQLAEAGFPQYEVSAYARPGRRCRHNVNYWEFGDYIGIGAGAHGKRTELPDWTVNRRWKPRQPRDYLSRAADGEPLAEERRLDSGDLILEFMMNALRLTGGFPAALFEARTGLPFAAVAGPLAGAAAAGLVAVGPERVTPTEQGRRFLNDLLMFFMPREDSVDRTSAG